ncbi:SRPBCC domain-containing protein [Mycobacterium sp. ITM-2016-00317]|uniref:SRPBCC domain-containing protein n=1 Tax=Mycobacterium sp. ITM-2016-00317 TaxID=2099694 RepID=UPI000D41B692|nr:SRPBCC domain-containing protein [Mycobacterium sp. ITM-2016-00317]WNG89831.1 SRPBCC domain-containing protein [Mycobacterium sp. ITM-2016-00317]
MAFQASRAIGASPAEVYAAFTDSTRLARWWGPAGFTNTFTAFAFEVGATWSFVMHGPDGRDYRNEITVTELDPPHRIVLHHVSGPRYLLTVTLEPTPTGTKVGWHQVFENADVGTRLGPVVTSANAELLDRLTTELTGR